MTIAVAVTGATGRMGRLILELIDRDDAFTLHAALSSADSLDAMLGADVLIDVTRLDVSERAVDVALEGGLDVVIGTSGWDATRIGALAERVPADRGVLVVPNFSLGSVLATHLATTAARFFDSVEILEAHHERKVDSPSGTAVRTAERIAAARDTPLDPPAAEQRARGEVVDGVPVHSLRLRGVVAEQRVLFGGTGELLEIRHETLDQSAYLAGIRTALLAAPDSTGVTVGLDALLGLDGAAR
ncbi:4-hydroxy-tetrahydrodipicolinate reductase [Pseudoclavibacter chungangensis]|uniref:4-hydroxy-tetrahydrodipicolinate reductase n=1 Tax=Pseudoclavibacter chungangensis TaxID=587635 RepID=A0A7J5BUV3_9MICO|nr:4-hydroxy-tetrahydrodipicolinate reductase [Pseudoclavibacter chungangensis]KAB1657278.1 4-hydroxy-tetrahydrodipicolinate reductase [Pseudoclavibacter chungangensis]NYJ66275.1 4-hydroxy-tetrahydrodipicolinate reductase [Pseudoclavibacter chungangensis]